MICINHLIAYQDIRMLCIRSEIYGGQNLHPFYTLSALKGNFADTRVKKFPLILMGGYKLHHQVSANRDQPPSP